MGEFGKAYQKSMFPRVAGQKLEAGQKLGSCGGVGAFVESGAKSDELNRICAIAKLMFPKTIDNTPTEREVGTGRTE